MKNGLLHLSDVWSMSGFRLR